MLKKIGLFLLWALLLVGGVLALWALALFQDWPWWYVPPMFIGVVLAVLLVRWGVRRWYAWRLRTKMQAQMPRQRGDQATEVDQDWNAGLGVLRASRLSRMGSPLYVLPWFLMLGQSGSGQSSLIPLSGLPPALRPGHRNQEARPAANTLDWWFLEHGIFLEPAGRLAMHSDASPEWRRSLYWLLRSRRREPLNGVMLVIDAHSLLTESEERLAEQGQSALSTQRLGPGLWCPLTGVFHYHGGAGHPWLAAVGAGINPCTAPAALGLVKPAAQPRGDSLPG